MRSLLILAAIFAVAIAAVDVETSFQVWRVENHKFYPNAAEYGRRFAIFSDNLKRVAEFNAAGHSFKVGMNYFADLESTEFVAQYTSAMPAFTEVATGIHIPSGVRAPASVDWRTAGIVNAVKNQGQCGSCYAFGAMAAMEGSIAQATGKLWNLAEQQVVDCSGEFGNQGCNGGWHNAAMAYIAKYSAEPTSSYPYLAKAGTCAYSASKTVTKINKCITIGNSEPAVLDAAAQHVVAIAIDASKWSFQMYKSGVYDEPTCSSTSLDHAVAIIGYGADAGKDFWLVRNSWGTSWGIAGYIEMSRNKKNQCGISTKAYYAQY
jgi:cathepsin L